MTLRINDTLKIFVVMRLYVFVYDTKILDILVHIVLPCIKIANEYTIKSYTYIMYNTQNFCI